MKSVERKIFGFLEKIFRCDGSSYLRLKKKQLNLKYEELWPSGSSGHLQSKKTQVQSHAMPTLEKLLIENCT